MKRILIFITIICWSFSAIAQNDPTAQKLLASVSKHYQSFSNAQINFTLKAVNHQQQTILNEKGVLIVEPKTDKFHIRMGEQEIISDGKLQWTILKEEQEVQVAEIDPTASASLTPATIFTFYKKGYKYISTKTERLGNKQLSVIELAPEDTKKQFFKVRLRVDQALKQIYDVVVFDKNGSRYTYSIQNLVSNIKIAPKTFIFDKVNYPDLEVVDLR